MARTATPPTTLPAITAVLFFDGAGSGEGLGEGLGLGLGPGVDLVVGSVESELPLPVGLGSGEVSALTVGNLLARHRIEGT